MALDPNAPGPWSWVPPEWNPVDAAAPDPLEVTLGPRGRTVPGTPPEPPPPPPPPPPPSGGQGGIVRQGLRIGEAASAAPDEVAASNWPPAEWAPKVQNSPDFLAGTVDEQGNLQRTGAPGLEADAISGADPRADVSDVIGGVRVEKPTEDQSFTGVNQRADARVANAPLPSIAEHENELAGIEAGQALASMPLEQQLIERAKIEGARQKFATARALDAADKAQRAAEENARTYQAALKSANDRTAELDVEAKKIADENPLDSISGTSKILGVIASFIGGFGMNKTGRNVGLEMVESMANDAAKRHADKLTANARAQANAGDQAGRAGDIYKSAEAVRLATYDGAIKMLESEVQNFDPRGTTALRVANQLTQLKAQRAASLAKYRDEELNRAEKLLKQQQELTKLAEDQRHNLATEKNDAIRAGADYLRAKTDANKSKKEDQVMPPEHFAQAYGGLIQPELLPKTPMTEKQFQQALQNTKEGREVATKIAARKITGVMSDGTDFVATAGDDTTVSKVRDQITAYKGMVRLIDDARRIRTGWTSDTAKSKEWQELKTIWANAKGKGKNALGLGAMSDSDFALVGEYLGTDDPTKARGVESAILKARQLIESDGTDALRSVGYKERWSVPDLGTNQPRVESENDKLLKSVLRNAPANDAENKAAQDRAKTDGTGYITDSSITAIEKWAADARSDDPAVRDVALSSLEAVANSGNKGAKDLAAKKLAEFATPNTPVTEEAGVSRGSVSYEPMPDQYGLPPEGQ